MISPRPRFPSSGTKVSSIPSYELAQRTATAFQFEIALLRIKKIDPVAARHNFNPLKKLHPLFFAAI